MVLKTKSALFTFSTLLVGAFASPVTIHLPVDDVDDTWFVWSDSTRCEGQDRIQVVIRDYSEKDDKGIIKSKPDILGEREPNGEILFKLKSPFSGSYVLSDTRGGPYAPPEIKIELFDKNAKPAGHATYVPGVPPHSLDRIQWNPDLTVPNQKVIRPSLEGMSEPVSKLNPDGKSYSVTFDPVIGKLDSVDTDTYADILWIIWCTGENDRLIDASLRTRLRTRLAGQSSVQQNGGANGGS